MWPDRPPRRWCPSPSYRARRRRSLDSLRLLTTPSDVLLLTSIPLTGGGMGAFVVSPSAMSWLVPEADSWHQDDGHRAARPLRRSSPDGCRPQHPTRRRADPHRRSPIGSFLEGANLPQLHSDSRMPSAEPPRNGPPRPTKAVAVRSMAATGACRQPPVRVSAKRDRSPAPRRRGAHRARRRPYDRCRPAARPPSRSERLRSPRSFSRPAEGRSPLRGRHELFPGDPWSLRMAPIPPMPLPRRTPAIEHVRRRTSPIRFRAVPQTPGPQQPPSQHPPEAGGRAADTRVYSHTDYAASA